MNVNFISWNNFSRQFLPALFPPNIYINTNRFKNIYIVNFESLNLYFKARNLFTAFYAYLAQIKNSSKYETFNWRYFSIHVGLSGGAPKMLA